MKIKRREPFFLGVLVCLLSLFWSCGNGSSLTLLSYNVENLFDDVDNGTEYREYDPSSGRWNGELMRIKLANIARVIRESVSGGPDIVCLQEVENRHVLELLATEYLAGLHYRVIYAADSGTTATQVAFLSRLPVLRTHIHRVPEWQGIPLRYIVEFEVKAGDGVLHIFNNHWKSKSGGEARTEKARLLAAEVLVSRIRELEQADPRTDIIIVGDLNECYDEYIRKKGRYQTALIPLSSRVPEAFFSQSLFLTPDPRQTGIQNGKIVLLECWYFLDTAERGSYVFKKEWQTLDHILLSAGLFDERGVYTRQRDFSVVRRAFMLNPKTGYPLRWRARSANKGYSDHLPLLIRLYFGDSP
jgi:endonuclease/exonuclease/phosphatase family metal-dependent hydrolase